MSVRPTSIQTYEELKQDGTLNFQENLIYQFIKRNKRYITDTKKGKCPLSGKNVGLLEIV